MRQVGNVHLAVVQQISATAAAAAVFRAAGDVFKVKEQRNGSRICSPDTQRFDTIISNIKVYNLSNQLPSSCGLPPLNTLSGLFCRRKRQINPEGFQRRSRLLLNLISALRTAIDSFGCHNEPFLSTALKSFSKLAFFLLFTDTRTSRTRLFFPRKKKKLSES